MQVQKDVLIAGGVVVVCVALVVVALVATGPRSEAPASSTDVATGPSPSTSFAPTAYDPPPSSTTTDSGLGGSDPYGGFAPAPGAGGSPFANEPSPTTGTTGPASSTAGDPWSTTATPTPLGTTTVTSTTVETPASSTGGTTHTVAKGETLGDISTTHYGTAKHWRKIVEANPGLDPTRLMIGQVIQIPVVAATAAPTAAAVPDGEGYTVQKGDSYYTIARKLLGSGSRWRELERLNNIPAESLRPGTVIRVPPREGAAVGTAAVPGVSGAGRTHIVAKGETLGDISKQYYGTTTKWKQISEANPGVRPENLKVGQSLAIPDLPSAAPAAAPSVGVGGNSYTVKAGDTLESIAAAHLGQRSAWKRLVEANPGLKPTALRVGQVIALPGASAAGGTAPEAAPAFAPQPGGTAPAAPAPAAPDTGFTNDPFYSPYESTPAAPRPPGASGI